MATSFRLRVAVSLALLTGVALTGFALQASLLVRSANLQRLDVELQSLVERTAAAVRLEDGGPAPALSAMRRLLPEDMGNAQLLIENADGIVVYQSSAWPASLDSALQWPRLRVPIAPEMSGNGANETTSQVPAAAPDNLAPQRGGGDTQPAAAPSSTIPGAGPAAMTRDKGPVPGPSTPPPEFPGPKGQSLRPSPAGNGERPPPPRFPPPDMDGRDRERPFPPPDNPGPRQVSDAAGLVSQPQATLGSISWLRDSATLLIPATAALAAAPVRPRPPPVTALYRGQAGGITWHVAMATLPERRVAIAVDEHAVDAQVTLVRNAFLLAVPVALAVIALGAWLMASRALQPLQQLAESMQRVTTEGLDERISTSRGDREFNQLIDVFNAMLARLERGFLQTSRFSADAAHELRTPLAILQGELERLIQSAGDGTEHQITLSRILDEVRRLSVISGKLLLLSRADSGTLRLELKAFDLSQRLGELIEDTQMLAPGLRVSGDVPKDLMIRADAALLDQILLNLVSNAIKYNVKDGWIHLTASRSAQNVFVTIANTSPGISPADLERVFDRFHRADSAHNRSIDGVGLGLSLAREIARAHGGDLTFEMAADQRAFLHLVLPRLLGGPA